MAVRKFPDWASSDIADIGNGDPNKLDPGAAKQASGWAVEKPLLQYMNWIQNLFGQYIRANNEYAVRATDYQASAGELVVADNATVPCNILLPDQPLEGQWVEVMASSLVEINAVTVLGNGNDIMVPGDQACDVDLEWTIFTFFWNTFTNNWRITISGYLGD